MLRRKVAVLLMVCAAVGTGCSSGEPSDELMVTDNPVAATAAQSPPAATKPAGAVTPFADVTALAYEPESATLAVATGDAVQLFHLGDTLKPTHEVAVAATTLSVSGADFQAAAGKDIVRITTDGDASPAVSLEGTPSGAATLEDRTLVAVKDKRAVAVVRDGKVLRMISGDMMSADQVLSTGKGAVVLDRLRNAVFELDVRGARVAQGLRAGQGATNAVTDRFGRVLVADTRGGALLAFSLDPLLLRQNYPVAGAPYGMAYDDSRDLVWVTLTETNEVVGYAVAGEEPKEKYRFPTVAQPNTVAVDRTTGRVVVASGTGEGIQVIDI